MVWLIPAAMWAFVLAFTRRYASNVPYWDSWEFTELITGTQPLSLSVLWAQHNEHRMVWQTLFELVVGRWARWNIYRASFVPGILFAVNSLLLISRALQDRRSLDLQGRILLVAGLTLVLFSFRGYVTFTYEMVMAWGCLALSLTAFAWTFPAFLKTGRHLLRLVAILAAAAFSSSQGLALAVFVLLAAAGLTARGDRRAMRPSYAVAAAFSAALLIVYFVGYVKPTRHPAITSFLTDPLQAVRYMAVLAGSPFAWDETWATWIGVGVLALFCSGLFALIRRAGWQSLWHVFIEHPLIGTNLIAMIAIMVGRVGFGAGQATASHYVPFNAIFVVSALLLAFDQIRSQAARKVVLLVVLAAIVPAWYLGYRNAVGEMLLRRNPLEAYRECVLANPIEFSRCDGSHVYPHPPVLAARTVLLRDHHLAFFATTK